MHLENLISVQSISYAVVIALLQRSTQLWYLRALAYGQTRPLISPQRIETHHNSYPQLFE